MDCGVAKLCPLNRSVKARTALIQGRDSVVVAVTSEPVRGRLHHARAAAGRPAAGSPGREPAGMAPTLPCPPGPRAVL